MGPGMQAAAASQDHATARACRDEPWEHCARMAAATPPCRVRLDQVLHTIEYVDDKLLKHLGRGREPYLSCVSGTGAVDCPSSSNEI